MAAEDEPIQVNGLGAEIHKALGTQIAKVALLGVDFEARTTQLAMASDVAESANAVVGALRRSSEETGQRMQREVQNTFHVFKEYFSAANENPVARIELVQEWLRYTTASADVIQRHHWDSLPLDEKVQQDLDIARALQEPNYILVTGNDHSLGFELGSILMIREPLELSSNFGLARGSDKLAFAVPAVALKEGSQPQFGNPEERHELRIEGSHETVVVGMRNIEQFFLQVFEPTILNEDGLTGPGVVVDAIGSNLRFRRAIYELDLSESCQEVVEQIDAELLIQTLAMLGLGQDGRDRVLVNNSTSNFDKAVKILQTLKLYSSVTELYNTIYVRAAEEVEADSSHAEDLVAIFATANMATGEKPTQAKKFKTHQEMLAAAEITQRELDTPLLQD